MSSGKRGAVDRAGQRSQPQVLKAHRDETSSISLCESKHLKYLPIVKGLIGTTYSDILLDSGSSVSLVSNELVTMCSLPIFTKSAVNISTASCANMRLTTGVELPISIGRLIVNHEALVSQHLVAPVILGTDFLTKYGIQIDFKNGVIKADGVGTIWSTTGGDEHSPVPCAVHQCTSHWVNAHTVTAFIPDNHDEDDCSIPFFW